MPDVNWTVPAVAQQYGDDAVWWLDTFDLDGFRVDAVKHVEDLAIMNLSTRIRTEFEASGTRVFMTGETAMGWSDCGLACNADQYGTIARYIGPWMLDGQFDFVLYHGVAYNVYAYGNHGMLHTDYWSQASLTQYPAGAIMTPYIGSQDTARFVTLSTYRGQAGFSQDIANNKWTNIASGPVDGEPYARHRLALAWLLTQPGAPMLYYGDEYGDWGGADPNNRKMWRDTVTGEEATTLDFTRRLGTARKNLRALRVGGYVPIYASETDLVFARRADKDVAIVALTLSAQGTTVTVDVPATLGLADGTSLSDRLGGAAVGVAQKKILITLPSRGTAIYAP
jgi:glycosidase